MRDIELTPDNIYQVLWENDPNQFSVSPRNPDGSWANPDADILLDEQLKAGGHRNIDLAKRPLFHRVNEDKFFDDRRTYVLFIELLNNYTVRVLDPEFASEAEQKERDDFLEGILPTPPVRLALRYINEQFGLDLSPERFRAVSNAFGSRLYTNYSQGRPTEFASGLEHVFVGEGRYDGRGGMGNLGTISGYHSWVKFLFGRGEPTSQLHGLQIRPTGKNGPCRIRMW